MELETVFMTKATQTQKGKYHLFSIFYFIFVTIFYVSGELIKSLVYWRLYTSQIINLFILTNL